MDELCLELCLCHHRNDRSRGELAFYALGSLSNPFKLRYHGFTIVISPFVKIRILNAGRDLDVSQEYDIGSLKLPREQCHEISNLPDRESGVQ